MMVVMPGKSVQIRELVQDVVLSKLEEILARSRSSFSNDDDFTETLKIDSDDISFWFIPEVEAELGVSVPRSEWRTVATIGEVCELLVVHCERKGKL